MRPRGKGCRKPSSPLCGGWEYLRRVTFHRRKVTKIRRGGCGPLGHPLWARGGTCQGVPDWDSRCDRTDTFVSPPRTPFTPPPVPHSRIAERWCIMPHVPGADSPGAWHSRHRLTARGVSRPGMPHRLPEARTGPDDLRNSAPARIISRTVVRRAYNPNIKISPWIPLESTAIKVLLDFLQKSRGPEQSPGAIVHKRIAAGMVAAQTARNTQSRVRTRTGSNSVRRSF